MPNNVLELTQIGAAALLVVLIGSLAASAIPWARRIGRIMDLIEGSPGRPNIDARVDELSRTVDSISREVSHDSGSSLRDAVLRIEQKQNLLERRVDDVARSLGH